MILDNENMMTLSRERSITRYWWSRLGFILQLMTREWSRGGHSGRNWGSPFTMVDNSCLMIPFSRHNSSYVARIEFLFIFAKVFCLFSLGTMILLESWVSWMILLLPAVSKKLLLTGLPFEITFPLFNFILSWICELVQPANKGTAMVKKGFSSQVWWKKRYENWSPSIHDAYEYASSNMVGGVNISLATGEDALWLRTLFRLCLWTGTITQQVRIFRGDDNLVLLESLGIEPHFSHTIAMLQDHSLVLIWDPIPMSVMFAICTNLVRLATLPGVQAKIQTNIVFQLSFFVVGLSCGDTLLGVEKAHSQALIGGSTLPLFFFMTRFLAVLFLTTFALGRGSSGRNNRCNIDQLWSAWWIGK